jgi:hypothetical protein
MIIARLLSSEPWSIRHRQVYSLERSRRPYPINFPGASLACRLRNRRSCYNLVYVGPRFDQYKTYQLKRSAPFSQVPTLPNVASRRERHLRRVLPVSPMLLGPKNQPILPACRDDLGDGGSGSRMHTLWSRLVGFHYFATSVQSCFIRPDLTTADPICSSAHS